MATVPDVGATLRKANWPGADAPKLSGACSQVGAIVAATAPVLNTGAWRLAQYIANCLAAGRRPQSQIGAASDIDTVAYGVVVEGSTLSLSFAAGASVSYPATVAWYEPLFGVFLSIYRGQPSSSPGGTSGGYTVPSYTAAPYTYPGYTAAAAGFPGLAVPAIVAGNQPAYSIPAYNTFPGLVDPGFTSPGFTATGYTVPATSFPAGLPGTIGASIVDVVLTMQSRYNTPLVVRARILTDPVGGIGASCLLLPSFAGPCGPEYVPAARRAAIGGGGLLTALSPSLTALYRSPMSAPSHAAAPLTLVARLVTLTDLDAVKSLLEWQGVPDLWPMVATGFEFPPLPMVEDVRLAAL